MLENFCANDYRTGVHRVLYKSEWFASTQTERSARSNLSRWLNPYLMSVRDQEGADVWLISSLWRYLTDLFGSFIGLD